MKIIVVREVAECLSKIVKIIYNTQNSNFYYPNYALWRYKSKMGNELLPTMRLDNEPSLDHHSTIRHPLYGEVKVYTY